MYQNTMHIRNLSFTISNQNQNTKKPKFQNVNNLKLGSSISQLNQSIPTTPIFHNPPPLSPYHLIHAMKTPKFRMYPNLSQVPIELIQFHPHSHKHPIWESNLPYPSTHILEFNPTPSHKHPISESNQPSQTPIYSNSTQPPSHKQPISESNIPYPNTHILEVNPPPSHKHPISKSNHPYPSTHILEFNPDSPSQAFKFRIQTTWPKHPHFLYNPFPQPNNQTTHLST